MTAIGDAHGKRTATGDPDGKRTATGDPDGKRTAIGDAHGKRTAIGDAHGKRTAIGDPDGKRTATGDPNGKRTATGDPNGKRTATGDTHEGAATKGTGAATATGGVHEPTATGDPYEPTATGDPYEPTATGDLYERLKVYEGRPAATAGVGKDPVNEAMIRHWCEAMGDANPAYQGPDAIAPPTMLQAWTMGGLSGHQGRSGAYDELSALLDGAGYTAVVATDCEQEYLRPLRPGSRITFDAVIESVSERKTTKLGTGHFVTTRMDVRADGGLAGTHRFRILKYAPARRKASPAPSAKTRRARRQEAAPLGEAPLGEAPAKAQRPRPRPVINRDNAGFWEGVRRHTLLIQRCGGCRRLRFPWLPGCQACGSPEWDTVEASGTGTVYSYVVMHHPPFPAFDPPYAVGLIELAEGVRMVSNVIGVPHDKVRIGMPVQLEFLCVDGELELPVFRGGEELDLPVPELPVSELPVSRGDEEWELPVARESGRAEEG